MVTQVFKAGERSAALAELCARYRYPVYAYLRRSGHLPAIAMDIAQSFLGHVQRKFGERSTPTSPQFRRFLLAYLQDYLTRDWRETDDEDADERDSQKRGESIETRLVNWSELVRDAAVAATGVADRAMRPDRADESRRLAAKVTTRDLVDLAQRMERWRRDVVETTVSARMLLELFALRLPYDETFAEAA